MSKISLTNLVNLQNQTTAVSAINANNAVLITAMDNTLSRDGTSPNTMGASLDMNSNQILNLPVPSTVNSPARLIDVVSNPTISIPGQGTSGHVVPFLDGNNTWSGTNTFNANTTVASETITGTATFNNPIVVPTNSISNTSLGTMAANTVKGSIAGGTPADLTKTQLTTLINPVTTSLPGIVPAFPNNTTTFFRGDGTYAVVPSGTITYNLLNTLTASASATLSDLTSFTATYTWYEIILQNIVPSVASTTLELQVHSGGSFQATSYLDSVVFNSGAGSGQTSNTTFIPLNATSLGATSVGLSGSVRVSNPSATTFVKMWNGQTSQPNNTGTNLYVSNFGGYWSNNAAIDGFQILFSSGNITSGTVKIYGIL